MPLLPHRLLVALTVATLTAGLVGVPAALAAPPSPGSPSDSLLADPVSPEAPGAATAEAAVSAQQAAVEALDAAQDQLASDTPVVEDPVVAKDFTLLLRDLRAGLPHLSRTDAAAARRILARPTDGGSDPNGDGYAASAERKKYCPSGANVCVHWVNNTVDAPPGATLGGSAPAQVLTTSQVLNHVYDRVVTQGGYRAPLADGRGGDDRLDVYLADIGDDGLFGYCAPERAGSGRSATGYCVLDDDYSPTQYGSSQSPLDNLRVTAAHEFFHAVQFAYDAFEDDWFMEGTAMWIEDELYDHVNDSRRYLRGGPLTHPLRSLDRPAAGLAGPYASWIFWRWVSESYPDRGSSGLPLVIRDTWRRAQGYTASQPGTYSLRAVALAIAARGGRLANTFALFGEASRHPGVSYEEGKEDGGYPVAPLAAAYRLSTSKRSITEKVATLDHLSNVHVAFVPDSSLDKRDWRLRIPVNAPSLNRGSKAQVTVYRTNGAWARKAIRLNTYGNGAFVANFRAGVIKRVELTITNAGTGYRCNQGTFLSCRGVSKDDGLRTYFKGVLLTP